MTLSRGHLKLERDRLRRIQHNFEVVSQSAITRAAPRHRGARHHSLISLRPRD
jgi:hypothetical protein